MGTILIFLRSSFVRSVSPRNLTQRVERLRKFLSAFAVCFHKINRFYSHTAYKLALIAGQFLAHLVLAPPLMFVTKHQGPPHLET